MLELAIKGDKKYYGWVALLLAVAGAGFLVYLWQLKFGLGITGLSRDVTWGFYIAQFTFLVGVAASAVMVVIPYYLHNYKKFGKMAVLGEFGIVPWIVTGGSDSYRWLDEVVATLAARPPDLHVVVTGRNAKPELVEIADLVTEMTQVKHPFKAGVKAQKGIEF